MTSASAVAPATRHTGGLRANRSFHLLFGAQFISNIGTWFANVAVIGAILDATDGAGYAGVASSLVFVATSFPQFVLMPFTGAVADRVDRRRLIAWGSVVQAIAALSFCAIGDDRWWLGIVAQLLISTVAAFLNPATSAAIPNLVAPADVPRANALLSSTFGITLALGSMFGGIFAATFGRTASFVANALSFLAVALLVVAVRGRFQQSRSRRAPVRPIADTRAALGLARRDPFVLSLFGARLAFGITIGAVGVLPLVSTEVFDRGDSGTGLLLAARGIGFLFGPAVVTAVVRRGSTATVTSLAVGLITFGVGYLVVGVAPTLAIACLGVFVGHLGGGSISTISSVALQLATPDGVRGRMVATDRALAALSQTISYPLVGLAAGAFGPVAAVLGCAALSVALGSAFLLVRVGESRRDRTLVDPADAVGAEPAGRAIVDVPTVTGIGGS